jgi:ABC-2 type transport system ATP-binding protein
MSVKVEALVKEFGSQRAVDEVSFEVGKGKVLGFLGPNGAGKTTTMKMVTGYLPQTSGKVLVCGMDTLSRSLETRACIGYLPEHNPLYKEMYVREYLHFASGLHKIKRPKLRVDEMIERTGLGSHRHKQIGQLSKGYRQRVGLAQALLHDPQVLILDEPTSGLDPNQIIEIRHLIKDLGREKTVILSTHILGEVEAICDRALIINKGKLVADAGISELKQQHAGQSLLTVGFAGEVARSALKGIIGVDGVKELGNNRWQLTSEISIDVRSAVFEFALKGGHVILEMQQENSSVEEIFQQLTR